MVYRYPSPILPQFAYPLPISTHWMAVTTFKPSPYPPLILFTPFLHLLYYPLSYWLAPHLSNQGPHHCSSSAPPATPKLVSCHKMSVARLPAWLNHLQQTHPITTHPGVHMHIPLHNIYPISCKFRAHEPYSTSWREQFKFKLFNEVGGGPHLSSVLCSIHTTTSMTKT